MRTNEPSDFGGPAFFRNAAYFYGPTNLSGTFSVPYAAKTGAYTLTESDYAINITSGTFTVTLPTAVGIAGRVYVIKNSGTGNITVDANGSQTLDGSTTVTLYARYSSITIQSDGANWVIIGCISPVGLN